MSLHMRNIADTYLGDLDTTSHNIGEVPENSSPENNVASSLSVINPFPSSDLDTNAYQIDTCLEMNSTPNGSREFLVDEVSIGCLKSASACSRRVRDWCYTKLQSVGSAFQADDKVIELTPMNTDNIFMVNGNSSNLNTDACASLEVSHDTNGRQQSQQVDIIGRGCCRSIRRCASAQCRNASTYLKSSFDWSVLQAYNTVAFSTCSVPYRLELADDGKYTIKSYVLQKIAWAIQMVVVVAGLCRRSSVFVRNMHFDQTDPFEYMRLASVIVTALASLIFIKVVASSSDKLLQIHQAFKTKNNNNLPHLHSKKVGLITCVLLYCYIFTTVSIDVAIYVQRHYDQFVLSPAPMLQAFACFSREAYLWQKVDKCENTLFLNLSDVPYSELILGVLGMLTFVCDSLFGQTLVLVLLACSITLFIPAWYATCVERFAATGTYQLTTKHELLTELSQNLSRFIGLILAVELVNVAFALPVSLKLAIIERNIAFLPFMIMTTVNLASYLIASASSMLIDELEEEFTNPENRNELPRDGVAATAFFHKLFRKSLGIGYRGLFVLNFRFLFGYLGIIGTFIMILYEAAKDTIGQSPNV